MPQQSTLIFLDEPLDVFIKARTLHKVTAHAQEPDQLASKVNKLKSKLIAAKNQFVASGLQGFSLGCVIGLGIGVVSAIQTRRLVSIPFCMISSSLLLSFLMSSSTIINLDVGTSKRGEWACGKQKGGESEQNGCATKTKLDLLS